MINNMDDKIKDLRNLISEMGKVCQSLEGDSSPGTVLKTSEIELTADELLFINAYASSKPMEDEEEVNLDILEMIKLFTRVENVSLLLLDKENNSLVTRYSVGKNCDLVKHNILAANSGIAQLALQTVDIQSSNRADSNLNNYWGEEIKSFLLCPMEEKGNLIGVISLFNKLDGDTFNSGDINFITYGENVLSKYYYYYENQNLFVTTLKKRNNVDELKDISRSDMSYLLAEISENIVKLYKKDPTSLEIISDHTKKLLKMMSSYI